MAGKLWTDGQTGGGGLREDTDERRCMGTRGRGAQTSDTVRGSRRERQETQEKGTSIEHQAWGMVRAGSRGEVGAPHGFRKDPGTPPLPLLLPRVSGGGCPTKLKTHSLLPHLTLSHGGASFLSLLGGRGETLLRSPWLL